MSHAAIYARLSQQGEDSESITRQINLGIQYAKDHDLPHTLYVEPPGARSGYYEHNRPTWKQLKRDLASKNVDIVIVADLARAHRNTAHQLAFIDWLLSIGGTFVSLRENIDPTTAAGKLMLTVLAGANEWYRNDVSERKRRQLKERNKSIYASNVHPYGLSRSGHYPAIQWTPTPDFPAVILIAELYTSGYAPPAIAKELNARGVKWINRRKERVAVSPHAVEKAIRAFARYQSFLDPALYTQFILHRTQQSQPERRTRRNKHESFRLTGLLYCAHCHTRFHSITQHTHRHYGTYTYQRYQHRNALCVTGNYNRRLDLVESQVWDKLEWLNHLSPVQIANASHSATDTPQSQGLDVKLQRDKLIERLRGYEEMRADKEITRERFLQVKQEIEQELADIPEPSPAREASQPITYEHIYALFCVLVEKLKDVRLSTPVEVNAYFRTFIHRVWFDGETVTRVQLLSPFNLLERTVEPTSQ